MNPVCFFEIPVRDLVQATAFYERTFGMQLTPMAVDGNQMAMFPFAEGAPGASGALAQGESYVPGSAGARIYFAVDDIHATLQAALAAGATAHYPVTEVPDQGWVAEFLDPEGNCIALFTTQQP
jgi:uncharacterized protein